MLRKLHKTFYNEGESMIISEVKIVGSNFPTIDLNEKLNLIIGETGAKKTLLYKLIMFVFGFAVNLDIENVKRNFGDAKSVELIVISGNDKISIRKDISNDFKGYIGDKEFSSAKAYNAEINNLFAFDVKLLKSGTKSSSFGFKEFLNFISIPEEQLASSKSIFFREGFSEKEKILNFFKYIVSGEAIGEHETREQTSLSKDEKSIKGFQTALNRRFRKPTSKEIKDRDRLSSDLNQIKEKQSKVDSEIFDLDSEKKRYLITLERINSIYKTYVSYLEETKAGLAFKSNVSDGDQSDVDVLFLNNIEKELNGLEESIKYINLKLKKINKSIVDASNLRIVLNNREKEIANDLEQYKFIEQYETASNASILLFENIKNGEKIVQEKIKDKKEKIESTYKENLVSLCENVSSRLNKWGLTDIQVSFDALNADFIFNKERLSIVPKGLKSIYSSAVACELLCLAKKHAFTSFNTLIIDSLWVATYLEDLTQKELVHTILDDLLSCNIQTIIFENSINTDKMNGLNIINI